MPPKQKKSQPGSKKGTNADRQQHRRDAKKPKKEPEGPPNSWGHCDAKLCKTCKQTTHDIDKFLRASGIVEYLMWTKPNYTADGESYPAGEDCFGPS